METKRGSCHCGNVQYQVEINLSEPVIECNCSHCQIKGLLLSFVPLDAFTLTQGQESLTDYRFNTHVIEHLFCPTCGVQPFGKGEGKDGKKMVAINVRTITGIDLGTLTKVPYDGKSK